MKAVCPICGKRVELLKSGRLAAHLVTGVSCHGPLLGMGPALLLLKATEALILGIAEGGSGR